MQDYQGIEDTAYTPIDLFDPSKDNQQIDLLRYQDRSVVKVYQDIFSRDLVYRDLDLDMKKHPFTGNIPLLEEANAVRRALKNLILTEPGEKPFNPYFGTPLNGFLFELDTTASTRNIIDVIKNSIKRFEPRVSVTDIEVTMYPENNAMGVRIIYWILSLSEDVRFEAVVKRTR
jgi:phage baseplate assembly protein W